MNKMDYVDGISKTECSNECRDIEVFYRLKQERLSIKFLIN